MEIYIFNTTAEINKNIIKISNLSEREKTKRMDHIATEVVVAVIKK